MRSFECYYHSMSGDKLVMNTNTNCWAGIRRYSETNLKGKEIYIERYTEDKTSKYIPLMIEVINEITPCELVEIDKATYIKVTLLETYDQSLIVLNFIRNLWCHNVSTFDKADMGIYTKYFFETLETSKVHTEPLERLTHANIVGLQEAKVTLTLGHSNAHDPKDLVVRNTKQLLEYKGNTTRNFLQGKAL